MVCPLAFRAGLLDRGGAQVSYPRQYASQTFPTWVPADDDQMKGITRRLNVLIEKSEFVEIHEERRGFHCRTEALVKIWFVFGC